MGGGAGPLDWCVARVAKWSGPRTGARWGVGGVWAWCVARVVCAHAGGDGVIGGGRRVCVVARLCDGAGRRG